MYVKTDAEQKNPSDVFKRALRARGYLLRGRFYRDSQPEEACQLSYYQKGTHRLVLEITCNRASREETACALYRTVSTSPTLADTIAAIP